MAFQFAYSLDGSAVSTIKDFPLDTVTNYKSGAGTNDVKKGDGVLLNAGLIRRQANVASPKIIGVVEGIEFTGLAGAPYTAVNSSFTSGVTDTSKYPNGIVKVRVESDSVYRIALVSGQTATNANIGVAYGIALSAAGDQTVDLTNTTNLAVKIVDRSADGKTVYVVVSSNSTF